MRLLNCALIALALSGVTCQAPTGLRPRHVSGVVRYTDGRPVWKAKVWTDTGATTFSDARGRYLILVLANADSVTLSGRDGYTPGVVYAVTHFGSVRIRVGPTGAKSDIVLDGAAPI